MAVASLSSQPFGHLPGGESVEAWSISGWGGLVVEIITYGGIIRKLLAPGRDGRLDDVVLGFNRIESYLDDQAYMGAVIGRVAGRIPGARLLLDGNTYELTRNEGRNHLHGGFQGFNRKLWRVASLDESQHAPSLRLECFSPDSEEGYPGSVSVSVTYTVTPENVLRIRSEAVSERTTPLSLTFHPYFNLGGDSSGSIAEHQLEVHAEEFVAVDEHLTPLGGFTSVTCNNDFRRLRKLGDAIPQLFRNHGDLYRIRRTLDQAGSCGLVPAARLMHGPSGRVMTVSTTARYLQFYTGSGLDGTMAGKQSKLYERFAGVCLECEGYPNGANDPAMGDILLRPGQLRSDVTEFAFSVI